MESLANQYNIDGTVNPLVIGICILLILHKGSEKARGFDPGMNQADGMFKYTYFK